MLVPVKDGGGFSQCKDSEDEMSGRKKESLYCARLVCKRGKGLSKKGEGKWIGKKRRNGEECPLQKFLRDTVSLL